MVTEIFFVLLIAIPLVKGTTSNNMNICVTWKLDGNRLKIICKIHNLEFNVQITDQTDKEWAICLPPASKHPAYCLSVEKTAKVTHKPNTSVIELTIEKPADKSMNGFWTCLHGVNKDKASVEVTIPEPFAETRKDSDCIFTLLSSTLIAFVSALVVIRAAIWIWGCVRNEDNTEMRIFTETQNVLKTVAKCSRCIIHDNKQSLSVCRKIIVVFLIVHVVSVPLVVGAAEQGTCRGPIAFYVLGVLFGMITSLMLLEKDTTQNSGQLTHEEQEEQVPLEQNVEPTGPMEMEEESAV